jgi:hypothetical protein
MLNIQCLPVRSIAKAGVNFQAMGVCYELVEINDSITSLNRPKANS